MTLADIVARNLGGEAVGLPSWCTAEPHTLAAILHAHAGDDAPVLIEATCNQVNQTGGYTGMTPADFAAFVHRIAVREGVARDRIIFGGDHLGPNPWRHLPADRAMAHAKEMVGAYVEAGFTKIHLDASMPCNGEILEEAEMARRAADLCAVAEAAGAKPVYVIGTEVPVPGGETGHRNALAITTPDAARRTLAMHHDAFAARGLEDAFGRIVGLVVQPGVDFGNAQVIAYDPVHATGLAAAALSLAGPLFEAHSTDYQTPEALIALVRDHFAVLKVGPELTFAFRQAVMALERLESDLGLPSSGVTPALLGAMRARPADWRPYIEPGAHEERLMLYGLSDRLRYYWPDAGVQAALAHLFGALRHADPPPGLVAQVTGGLVEEIAPVTLPEAVIRRTIGAVVAKYRSATGM